MERHVRELYDWVRNNNEAAPTMQCAILDVVSWFLSVLQLLVKRRRRSAVVRPCDRRFSSVMEDWAARAPSCCVTWWQRRWQTDSAAHMLSEDGGPSWNECCWLHKQTHTCERWDPESRSDLLLSPLCCWQSRVCTVPFGGACKATLL